MSNNTCDYKHGKLRFTIATTKSVRCCGTSGAIFLLHSSASNIHTNYKRTINNNKKIKHIRSKFSGKSLLIYFDYIFSGIFLKMPDKM